MRDVQRWREKAKKRGQLRSFPHNTRLCTYEIRPLVLTKLDFVTQKGLITLTVKSSPQASLEVRPLTAPSWPFQMLSTVLNIIIFEDCRNQWSMSRPLLGLILLNEKVGLIFRRLPLCGRALWVVRQFPSHRDCLESQLHLSPSPPSPVFLRPTEQYREQPAPGEAASHAPLLRKPHGGHRAQPAHQEPRQVSISRLPQSAACTAARSRISPGPT